MKLIALIKDLFDKAGVKLTDQKVTEFMATGSIQDVEIPDEIANQVNSGLMNLAAAENNPTIRAKLIAIGRSEAYDGVDSEINNTMNELGISEEAKTRILAEKSTTKRAAMLAKEVKESGAKGAGNSKELTEQVNVLNKKIADMQAEHTNALGKKDAEFAEKYLSQSISFDLAGFNYIFPDATPIETKLAAAMSSINRRLSADGVKVVTDAAGNKKVVKNDGTDYYDSHNKAVTYKDYITAALTQDNLLAASKEPTPGAGNRKQPPVIIPGQEDKGDQTFIAAADSDIDNLDAALKRDGVNI